MKGGRGEETTPVLSLSNVESGYGRVRAVRGVSIRVKQGEIAALLGSNGAGKTSLLKTISGVLRPTRGSVLFKGTEISGAEPSDIVRSGLSHVPEGREIFPVLTVLENLLMGAYTRKDRDGVARDLETVYGYFPVLQERKNHTAGLLSGGQQQMLAISRALMAAPQLILLDEPSLGLSPKLTMDLFHIIVRINRERGVAILVVEQNANIALNAADYVYVLENGRIALADSSDRLRESDRIREFYLGATTRGSRGERRDTREKLLI